MDGIGVNGMGRIGRLLLRKAFSEGNQMGITEKGEGNYEF